MNTPTIPAIVLPFLLMGGMSLSSVSCSTVPPLQSQEPSSADSAFFAILSEETDSYIAGEYIIKPGDTVEKIAKRHGFTIDEFMALNPGLEPRRLKVGQHVAVTDKQSATPTQTIHQAAESGNLAEATDSTSTPTLEQIAPVFRKQIREAEDIRIFDMEKSLATSLGKWLDHSNDALFVSINVNDAQLCHADNWYHEFVGVVDPKTYRLQSGVHHLRGDFATTRELASDGTRRLLCVLSKGGCGYRSYKAEVLTFIKGGVRIQPIVSIEESQDTSVETTESGEVIVVVRHREGTTPDVLKTLLWDKGNATFAPAPDLQKGESVHSPR